MPAERGVMRKEAGSGLRNLKRIGKVHEFLRIGRGSPLPVGAGSLAAANWSFRRFLRNMCLVL